jgi:hypothetical protein
VCRPEESVYLEHGVQQKQAIYEGLVLKTQESDCVLGRLATLASAALVYPGLFCPAGQGTSASPFL